MYMKIRKEQSASLENAAKCKTLFGVLQKIILHDTNWMQPVARYSIYSFLLIKQKMPRG